MPYRPDFTTRGGDERVRSVGWLSKSHPFPAAVPDPAVLDRLWVFSGVAVNTLRGLHTCEWCAAEGAAWEELQRRGALGCADIVVFGVDGVAYDAPSMLPHYMRYHHYRPPDEFLRAALDGPAPRPRHTLSSSMRLAASLAVG